MQHPAGDLINRIVTAHILHIHQRTVALTQHRAVDRPCLQIKRRRTIDLRRQSVKRGGAQLGGGKRDLFQPLHHIAKHGANRAAAGASLFLQLVFVTCLARGAHDDGFQLFIIVDACDLIIRQKHALIAQEPQREVIWVIANGHGGDNLLCIEKDRQRAFFDNGNLALRPVLIHAGDRPCQSRGRGIRRDDQIFAVVELRQLHPLWKTDTPVV